MSKPNMATDEEPVVPNDTTSSYDERERDDICGVGMGNDDTW